MDHHKHNAHKKLVKTICSSLFYLGMGDCWYESQLQTDFSRYSYKAWTIVANLYNVIENVNILLAYLRTDLDEKEHNDLVQFIIAHFVITAKIVSLHLKRKHIKEFLFGLLEYSEPLEDTNQVVKASVKKSFRISAVIGVCIYFTLLVSTVDGIRAHIVEGVGNCWYETRPTTKLYQSLYKIWMVISNFYTFSFMANEFLAYIRTDLTDEDRNDLVQFSLAHSIISGKIIFLYIEKKRIIYVLSRLLESDDLFFTGKLDRACVKKSVRLCAAVLIVSYMALLTTTFDGVRAHLADGVPIRTEVTYYPPTTASGLTTNTLRLFIQLHWWFAVTIMAGIDTLCISSLVIVGYKFKILQVYFSNLRKKVFSTRNKTRDALEEEFKNDFIAGIKMHGHALWCAKNVQGALGHMYSVQVFESVVLLVMCLIKIVSTERNLTFLVANMSYIGCLILLTGSYMLPAGDITHEASMVSTWMFHSGWEEVSSRDVRVLAVVALQRSQAPVEMSAFGILTLSYSNFISVIRSSYSFFAVMY